MESSGFSLYSIMSSVNNDSFTISVSVGTRFIIIFSCLIAVARTFTTLLNNNGESGYPCLVLDLKENAFGFSL